MINSINYYVKKMLYILIPIFLLISCNGSRTMEKNNRIKQCNHNGNSKANAIRAKILKKNKKNKRILSKKELIDKIKDFTKKVGILEIDDRLIEKHIKFNNYSNNKQKIVDFDVDEIYFGNINVYSGFISFFGCFKRAEYSKYNEKIKKNDIEIIKGISENKTKKAAMEFLKKILNGFPNNLMYDGYFINEGETFKTEKPEISFRWARHYRGIKFQDDGFGISLDKDLRFLSFKVGFDTKFDPNFNMKISKERAKKSAKKYAEMIIKKFGIVRHKIVKFLGAELEIVRPNYILSFKSRADFYREPEKVGRVVWVVKYKSKDTSDAGIAIPPKTIQVWIDVETGKCIGGMY